MPQVHGPQGHIPQAHVPQGHAPQGHIPPQGRPVHGHGPPGHPGPGYQPQAAQPKDSRQIAPLLQRDHHDLRDGWDQRDRRDSSRESRDRDPLGSRRGSMDILEARDLEERRPSKYKEILIDFEPQPCGAPCGAPCLAPCGPGCTGPCSSPPCSQAGAPQGAAPGAPGPGPAQGPGRRRHSFLGDGEILITDPPMGGPLGAIPPQDMSPCRECDLSDHSEQDDGMDDEDVGEEDEEDEDEEDEDGVVPTGKLVHPRLRIVGLGPKDSLDDEFHENLIYRGLFRKKSVSLEDTSTADPDLAVFPRDQFRRQSDRFEGEQQDLQDEGDTPRTSPAPGRGLTTRRMNGKAGPGARLSPFASSDSLAETNGIWNESQATVLQADSDNSADLSLQQHSLAHSLHPSTAHTSALSPASRRKHMLMVQHQQRSSIDTDVLDEDPEPVQ
ncbi:uncharacterized protein LOC113205773, partial [Frankliniella occidentalis]|uniref:Uncharacterized protein LOC113205773 n=1 Tax=Frankliniella occidentalis TaxID=133901 RepID=A0A9C6XBD8_FRAOC